MLLTLLAESVLWCWAWAGIDGENVVTQPGRFGPVISRVTDLSGCGNDLYSGTYHQPGYRVGVTLEDGWSTDLPLIALHRYPTDQDHYGNVYFQDQTIDAWQFYYSVAFTNSRGSGLRTLLGSSLEDYVWLDQRANLLEVRIAGKQFLTLPGSLPIGPVLLELARDSSGVISVRTNGQEVFRSAPNFGLCRLSGVGLGPSNSSHFDDYLMEVVLFRSLPDPKFQALVRSYLRSKWQLY